MPCDTKVYLQDILQSILRIRDYTQGLSYSDFQESTLIQDGVVWNLAVIGEAIKQVPRDFQNKHSSIDWRKIGGLRDILVHAYFGIDLDIIWDIIEHKLGPLEEEIHRLF